MNYVKTVGVVVIACAIAASAVIVASQNQKAGAQSSSLHYKILLNGSTPKPLPVNADSTVSIAPTTWSLPPLSPFLSALPSQSLLAPAMPRISTDSTFGDFQVWKASSMRVSAGIDIFVGMWTGNGELGAIKVEGAHAEYTFLPTSAIGPVIDCTPGSHCVNGIEIVGMQGSEIMIQDVSTYVVLDWRTMEGYISNAEGAVPRDMPSALRNHFIRDQ
jgi:hypothetical protein